MSLHPYGGPGASQRAFGAPRDGGKRRHAGCDLYASVGTPVLAIAKGFVIRGPYGFYAGTAAIEVWHPGIGVVRYGEILHARKYGRYQTAIKNELELGNLSVPDGAVESPSLRPGQEIAEGDFIACVGKLSGIPTPMVHFELYDEAAKGHSLSGGGKYERHILLRDPTNMLLKLERHLLPPVPMARPAR